MRPWMWNSLVVFLVLVVAFWLWRQWSHPVLYIRTLPPQEIGAWQALSLEGWELRGGFYTLRFQGAGVVGSTPAGPTVLVLIGDGRVRVDPSQAQRSGRLSPGPPPRLEVKPLERIDVPFTRGYLRLHPHDPAWPRRPWPESPEPEPALLQEAQTLHAEKLPRYLSSGDRVRIPKPRVRVLELETASGPLLLLDAPSASSVYWLVP